MSGIQPGMYLSVPFLCDTLKPKGEVMKVVKLTKGQAQRLNITGAKPSRSVKVGPNSLNQPAVGRRTHGNNLQALVYEAQKRSK